jgi:tRNA U34 2-thiouridine synthase MnmA/TrmU
MNLITRAKDANKDQTYFIWQIKQEQLPHILFPVGEFDVKTDVRAFAESKGLITSNKPDSQGLCFVGQTSLRDMLLQTLGRKDGFIYTYLSQDQIDKIGLKVTKKNISNPPTPLSGGDLPRQESFKVKLGEHQGAFLYTIGQRQNLGISNGPWFVSEVDIVNNEVIVCHNEFQTDMESNVLLVKDLNWHLDITKSSIYTKSEEVLIDSEKLKVKNVFSYLDTLNLDNYIVFKLKLKGQIRYRSESKACDVFVFVPQLIEGLNPSDEIFRYAQDDIASFAIVKFDQPIRAAAKGQSIVFYDYDTDQFLIGGGVMEKAYKN